MSYSKTLVLLFLGLFVIILSQKNDAMSVEEYKNNLAQAALIQDTFFRMQAQESLLSIALSTDDQTYREEFNKSFADRLGLRNLIYQNFVITLTKTDKEKALVLLKKTSDTQQQYPIAESLLIQSLLSNFATTYNIQVVDAVAENFSKSRLLGVWLERLEKEKNIVEMPVLIDQIRDPSLTQEWVGRIAVLYCDLGQLDQAQYWINSLESKSKNHVLETCAQLLLRQKKYNEALFFAELNTGSEKDDFVRQKKAILAIESRDLKTGFSIANQIKNQKIKANTLLFLAIELIKQGDADRAWMILDNLENSPEIDVLAYTCEALLDEGQYDGVMTLMGRVFLPNERSKLINQLAQHLGKSPDYLFARSFILRLEPEAVRHLAHAHFLEGYLENSAVRYDKIGSWIQEIPIIALKDKLIEKMVRRLQKENEVSDKEVRLFVESFESNLTKIDLLARINSVRNSKALFTAIADILVIIKAEEKSEGYLYLVEAYLKSGNTAQAQDIARKIGSGDLDHNVALQTRLATAFAQLKLTSDAEAILKKLPLYAKLKVQAFL